MELHGGKSMGAAQEGSCELQDSQGLPLQSVSTLAGSSPAGQDQLSAKHKGSENGRHKGQSQDRLHSVYNPSKVVSWEVHFEEVVEFVDTEFNFGDGEIRFCDEEELKQEGRSPSTLSEQVIPALAHHSSPPSSHPRSSLRKALLGDSSQGSPQGSPLKYPLGSSQGSRLGYPLGSPQRSPLKHPKGSPLGSPPGSDGLSEALFGNLSQGSPLGSSQGSDGLREALFGNLSQGSPQGSSQGSDGLTQALFGTLSQCAPLGSPQGSSAYCGLSSASFGGCSQSSESVSSLHCTPTFPGRSPGSARPSLRRKLNDDGAVANLNNANENSLSGESLYSHLQQAVGVSLPVPPGSLAAGTSPPQAVPGSHEGSSSPLSDMSNRSGAKASSRTDVGQAVNPTPGKQPSPSSPLKSPQV
ncbi:TPA: hypothetical protein ACH3X3_003030 [Trebouxia sp. C0006]